MTTERLVFSSLAERLAGWDRAAYGVACRRIEILLLHGLNDKARDVLNAFIRCNTRERATLASHVADCLPLRLANCLEAAGYTTLHSVAMATDKELTDLHYFGTDGLAVVRRVISDVRAGRLLCEYGDDEALQPEWDLHHLLARLGTSTMSDKLTEALELLTNSGPSAAAEIDQKIAALTEQIAALRRLRRLLTPAAASKPKSTDAPKATAAVDYDRLATRIGQLIDAHGPLRPTDIAERLGDVSYHTVGRVVSRYDHLQRESDGRIRVAHAEAA